MESYTTFYSTAQERQSILYVRWQQREIGLLSLLGWFGTHFRSVIPVYLPLKEPRQETITNFTDWCRLTTDQNSHQGSQFCRHWRSHHPSSSYSEISSWILQTSNVLLRNNHKAYQNRDQDHSSIFLKLQSCIGLYIMQIIFLKIKSSVHV